MTLSQTVSDLQAIQLNVAALTNERDNMEKIVNDETVRLQAKQNSIEYVKTSQDRLIMLNENYSKVYYAYLKIIGIIVLTLLIVSIMVYFSIPIVLIIIIGGLGILWCLFALSDIYSRDNMNFDEIKIPSLIITPQQAQQSLVINKANGYLVQSVDSQSCVGSACCSISTAWDASLQQCI